MKKAEGKEKKTEEENIKEQKREFDLKLEKLKKELEQGKIDEIPSDMKKFKAKKSKPKTYKSYKKVFFKALTL